MPERIFKAKRAYLWLGLLYPLLFLNPVISILKPAEPDAFLLLGLLMAAMAAFAVFISGMFIQDLVLTPGSLRWVRVLFPQTTKELHLDQMLRIEVRQVGRNRQLCITTRDRKLHIINAGLYDDFAELVALLGEKTASDTAPVTPDIPMLQDIGNRPVHLIGLAVVLLLAGIVADRTLIQAWHCSSENMFSWLLVSMPLAIAVCYAYIRGEKKAQPLAAAVMAGILLGGVLNFGFLIANRWWTERAAEVSYQEFRFVGQEGLRQKWEPVHPEVLVFHDGYFHVADVWKEGYNPDLKPFQTYRIAVLKGALNDIAFPVDAFRQATPVGR